MMMKLLGLLFLVLAGFSAYDILFITKDYLWLIMSFILLLASVKSFKSE